VKSGPRVPGEEERTFLQQRLRTFALFMAILNLVGTLARAVGLLVLELPGGAEGLPVLQLLLLLVLATLSFGLLWVFTATGRRTVTQLHAAEILGLGGVVVAYDLVGLLVARNLAAGPTLEQLATAPSDHLALILARAGPLLFAGVALTYVFVLRAALVPSEASRTAWLTGAAGIPAAVTGALAAQDTAYLDIPWLTPSAAIVGAIAQWSATNVICTTVSHVIYGLQRQAQEAKLLGQYTLEERIGEGGMGVVYRASHAMLRRPTAIKLLPPEKAGALSLTRFEREVQLTARLTHPNTITIYDYGRTEDGILYYAMELLEGATLEEIVQADGPQPPGRVVHILEQVAGALSEAHAAGLVHRDVKPSNIILCRQGGELDVAKVVDFGLVKDLGEQAGDTVTVSQDGSFTGTPLYMAPELLGEGARPDPRVDLYALGAVGYYLLTGAHVFTGGSVIEVLGHHLRTTPVPPSERLGDPVPEGLEELLMQMLAKDPAARLQTASEVRMRLDGCVVDRWTARRAAAWWQAQGPAVLRRETPPEDAERTLTIALQDRVE
jgi:hypothetical protein